MDKNITEEQADQGISMLTGYQTRVPFADFWKEFNKQKKAEYDRVEKALHRMSFTKKIRMLEEINEIIDRYAKVRK